MLPDRKSVSGPGPKVRARAKRKSVGNDQLYKRKSLSTETHPQRETDSSLGPRVGSSRCFFRTCQYSMSAQPESLAQTMADDSQSGLRLEPTSEPSSTSPSGVEASHVSTGDECSLTEGMEATNCLKPQVVSVIAQGDKLGQSSRGGNVL